MQCTEITQRVMSRDDDATLSARFRPDSARKRQTPRRGSLDKRNQYTVDTYPTPPSTNIKLQSPSVKGHDPFADYAVYASYADRESPSKTILAEDPADVFNSPNIERQRRTSLAADKFHNAARRLALSSLSPQIQNQSPTRRLHFRTSVNDTSQTTPKHAHLNTGISSPLRNSGDGFTSPDEKHSRRTSKRASASFRAPPPMFRGSHFNNTVANSHDPQGRSTNAQYSFSRPRRMSRLAVTTPDPDLSLISSRARSDMEILTVAEAKIHNEPIRTIEATPEPQDQPPTQQTQDDFPRSPVDSTRTEDQVRASFDSAVSESLGDRTLQLKNWEIWIQRILFALFVFVINIALGLAYLGSHKHPYLLAVLVFIKSKDILSTFVDILHIGCRKLHSIIWPPKPSKSKWILSLICAYAETEEQIMKTVRSLAASTLKPHKQIICVILDGKPRDVLAHMTNVKINMQRPYTTWRGKRGEIKVHAGFVDETPIVFVEKVNNAGKKDSLILGHDLFNHPRDDMSNATKLLRKELWNRVLPAVISGEELKSMDYIFCTDADSTIHENALRRLANALQQEQNTIAACGVLFAELGDAWGEYAPWHLFQQFQYTFGQYVRRQAEGSWGRVTCLPGCITMIVVRPEMGDAISQYARPVTEHNIFRHQVQYLGTDRRLTWCMMSQNKHLRTLFVPEATSETVTPNSLSHYLSQRRRWASNAYFNDYFYAFGPHQRLITRLFAVIDLVRLTLVYYRVFNTVYFIHGLLTKRFYISKIIPTLVVTKTPALWYLLLISFREPVLRKRMHKLLLGMCINQIISPFLSVLVFTNVLFHMGSQSWGKTGFSTQRTPAPATIPAEPAPTQAHSPPSSTTQRTWTPRSLAKTVRDAIKGSVRRSRTHCAVDDPRAPGPISQSTRSIRQSLTGLQDTAADCMREIYIPGTVSGSPTATTSGIDNAENTPHPGTVSRSTTMSVTRRTPHGRKHEPLDLQPVKETPTRNTASSHNFDFGFNA